MGNRSLVSPGDVLLAAFPSCTADSRGQEGMRPVVVIGVPPEPLRCPVVLVAPLTSQDGSWIASSPTVYVRLPAGAAGLPVPSIVLLDQIRSVDCSRIVEYLGTLGPGDSARVRAGLKQVLAV